MDEVLVEDNVDVDNLAEGTADQAIEDTDFL